MDYIEWHILSAVIIPIAQKQIQRSIYLLNTQNKIDFEMSFKKSQTVFE